MDNEQPKSANLAPWVILGLVVLALVAGAVLFRTKLFPGSKAATVYNAVFLTNGQVFFGDITSQDSTTLNLADVYYIVQQTGSNGQSSPELVKMGSEFYGPGTDMQINKQTILFEQTLTPGSAVVKAITGQK